MAENLHVKFLPGPATEVKVAGLEVKHLEVTIEPDTRFGEPVVVVRVRLSDVTIHGEPEE